MDILFIEGPAQLKGEIEVSKAKNAYLPILAGVLLVEEDIYLKSVPNLRDIRTMNNLLTNLGVKVEPIGDGFVYNASSLSSHEATYDLVKTMRASICVLGPLVGKYRRAKVSLPGGCAIGTRPINLHLENLEKLGAEITLEGGYVEAKAPKGLKGTHLVLDFPSVGATENLMLAAVCAKGTTVIENCALEPEVSDLADFLSAMGAKITGVGTKTLTIEGVPSLHGGEYSAIGDRIEAATYIIAGLMTNSEINVKGFDPAHLEFVIGKLQGMGAQLDIGLDSVVVKKSELSCSTINTAPYPGFPTDVQAQVLALATQVRGTSIITENIFENRFMHVPELIRLGADITLKGNSAVVVGGKALKAAPVMCTDLRASAALVLAALCAERETQVNRVYHLDRGYDNLDKKLRKLGACLRRENDGY